MSPHKVSWRMSFSTYEEYIECIEKLSTLDPDYDFEEYGEVSERMSNLPGFPMNTSMDEVIVPVLPESIGPLVVLNVYE